jgi:hypothetical protein
MAHQFIRGIPDEIAPHLPRNVKAKRSQALASA